MKFIRLTVALFFAANCVASAAPAASSPREKVLLTGSGWKFMGAGDQDPLPTIDSDAFRNAPWQEVSVRTISRRALRMTRSAKRGIDAKSRWIPR